MNPDLVVHVNDRAVGCLTEDVESGLLDFAYYPGISERDAVSLTMPVNVPAHEYQGFNGLPPPFEISLPEGYLLSALRRQVGKYVNLDDDLALLRVVGRQTVGRVSFGGPQVESGQWDARILAAARSPQSARALMHLLETQPQQLGLSGVMPKFSLSAQAVPDPARPGTLVTQSAIVKFDTPDYPGVSLVEYACLQACQRAGIPVASAQLSPDGQSLRVTRFDEDRQGRRMGFEDACALSGLRRHGKYSGSIADLFEMIQHYVPQADQAASRETLLKQILMNDVLRNGDAHLKNFGLLYADPASPWLAPAYDVLTTQVWLREDLPALRLHQSDSEPAWLDAEALTRLEDMADAPGIRTLELHAQYREIALDTLNSVLQTQSGVGESERRALERACAIIHSAPPPKAVHTPACG